MTKREKSGALHGMKQITRMYLNLQSDLLPLQQTANEVPSDAYLTAP